MNVILASSSPYRRMLLEKLGFPFTCISPDIDESPLEKEAPRDLVARLAKAKAAEIAKQSNAGIVIASDQTACFNGVPLGKPHTVENAVAQLEQFSGNTVTFYTSLFVHNIESGDAEGVVDTYKVVFRSLTRRQIEAYVAKESPLDCAGSFKSEGLGITLFERLEGDDPNALIGLPLIKLVTLFHRLGLDPLTMSDEQ